jgi:hypothetical protein
VNHGAAGAVTGWSGGSDYFTIEECTAPDLGPVVDVLLNRRLGVVFRGYAGPGAAADLLERFRRSPAVQRRMTEAPSHYLGAYHYRKPPEQYLAESAKAAEAVADVLERDGSPWERFWCDLAGVLAADGVTVRPAAKDGMDACHGLVRSWVPDGSYALAPHEDASQCRDPLQADFEIARAADRICAVNLCLASGCGGELVVWNAIPDAASRERFGTTIKGGPYPEPALRPYPSRALHVRPGDLYVFRSGHVHAVRRHEDYRVTAAALMGFTDASTVVSWT